MLTQKLNQIILWRYWSKFKMKFPTKNSLDVTPMNDQSSRTKLICVKKYTVIKNMKICEKWDVFGFLDTIPELYNVSLRL